MLRSIFLKGICHKAEIVPGDAVRNDEDPEMGAKVIKELNCESNKIISVSGHHGPSRGNRIFQLRSVGGLGHIRIMGADGVNLMFFQYVGDLEADVLIQVIFHYLLPARNGNL